MHQAWKPGQRKEELKMNWETLLPLIVAIPFAILPSLLAIAGLIWGIYVTIRGEVRERRKARIAPQVKMAEERAFH